MKKIIIFLLLIIFCTNCAKNKIAKERENFIKEDSYIEVIPVNARKFLTSDSDIILMTKEEINNYNKEIKSRSNSFYDLDSISLLSQKEVITYIESYKFPSFPQYDDNREITPDIIEKIENNLNLDAIDKMVNVRKGIVTTRANLKSFPSDYHFYSEKDGRKFDNLQESELHVNTPLLIIHESRDKKWFLVITQNYFGWVLKDNISYVSSEEWDYFTSKNKFAVITSPFFRTDNVMLDMSTILPFEGEEEDSYLLSLPIRDKEGYLLRKTIRVSKDKAHVGYLPFSKKNIYIQAFRYENFAYSWGGRDGGIDCSSFVSNVFRTFGFEFPRNTSEQKKSVGKIISLEGKNPTVKQKIIRENYPSLLYEPGHVMLYLGMIDDKDYIIHASGRTMRVTFEELTLNLTHLTNIDRQVIIV